MQIIYDLVKQSPELYTWVFTIISTLCLVFVYFNKQSHGRELKKLEQNLRYDADRRLKIFDLKANEYSRYVTHLDEFGKKNNSEMLNKLQPIVDEYMKNYFAATSEGDKEKEIQVITWFGSQITLLTQDGMKEVMQLRHESNRIKLIATEDMLHTLESLESLTDQAMEHSNKFMNNFVVVISEQRQDLVEEYQTGATKLGEQIKSQTKLLMEQMRKEIGAI
jgi:truncated hemoglobin YjbI